MTRDEAVQRISDGLGFMASGNAMEAKIILRLQEAQRDLEKGKTLPKFLLEEDATLTLAADAHTVALPSDFLRVDDEVPIHFTQEDSDIPVFLEKKMYVDAVRANIRDEDEAVFPSVYVIRNSVIDFITTADQEYTLTWNYYKKAEVLTTNVENAWLANAPDWLIGEAGGRIAKDARDAEAIALFADMEKRGRAATFGEVLVEETSGGPFQMGANL